MPFSLLKTPKIQRSTVDLLFAHWSGDPQVEEKIKEDLGVTVRCIPFDAPPEEGVCPFTGKKSERRVIYAKAY